MRNQLIASAIAVCALAACSTSTAKTESAGTTLTPTTVTTTTVTTTTTVVQREQTIPTRTRYVVDGRNVDLLCKGHGTIPIVFQAGGRENGLVWNGLIASLGDNVFTCVFNRPGTTTEEVNKPPKELMTPSIVAKALAQTLRQAGVGPRVILVGHSSGGTDSIVFGAENPDMVAGAVLFDPSVPSLVPPDEWKRIGFDGAATIEQTRAVVSWPDVPFVILTADAKLVVANKEATTAEERAWIAGHRRWAHLSSEGTQREVPGTSHFVYLTAPEVARDTIRNVLRRAN
jgi:pimeloyl-ACP methyl ester carboxylesterase